MKFSFTNGYVVELKGTSENIYVKVSKGELRLECNLTPTGVFCYHNGRLQSVQNDLSLFKRENFSFDRSYFISVFVDVIRSPLDKSDDKGAFANESYFDPLRGLINDLFGKTVSWWCTKGQKILYNTSTYILTADDIDYQFPVLNDFIFTS
jgi:hypothetical protein